MLISKIEVYKLSIPMEPFVIATGTMDFAQNIFVRIYVDKDMYGVGECSAFPMIVGETQNTCFEVAKDFAKIWLNKDARDIEKRLGELNSYIVGNTTIKSAFDMAVYDLNAKIEGMSLYRFLGGRKRGVTTDITLGISTPQIMAKRAKELVSGGAEILKIKLGKEVGEDVDRIKAVRGSVGKSVLLRIDANQGWSYQQSLEALTALEKYGIQFCEQPMRSWDDGLLPQLKKQVRIPIMADESVYDHRDAERLCASDSCDFINIKLSKSGGISEALKIHEVAKRHGIKCMIGGMLESRLALSAKLHLAYACPNIEFFDLDTCMVGHLEDPVIGGVIYNGYDVSITDGLGIGADIEEGYLSKCEKWILK